MGFCEQLKKARSDAGLTQSEVAISLGVDKSTYCGYETGKRMPDVPKIKMLATILGTTGSALLETQSSQESVPVDKSHLSEVEKIILAGYHAAPENVRLAVNNLLGVPEQK